MEKLGVIYLRVSDPSQIDNNSLNVQEKICRDIFKKRNIKTALVLRDEGHSAKHINTRPAMRELLAYCTNKKNNISYVIVYKIDRWSRNTEEGLAAQTLLSKYGIEFLSATENIEKTPTGNLLKTILLALGQFDNELKGERVKDNMQALYRKGIWCWACPVGYKRPYGSKEQNKGKAPVPINGLKEILQIFFQEAATGLYTKQQLADLINAKGFERYTSHSAEIKTVVRIAKNTFYYGKMYNKKWDEYVVGQHEPIVSEELWTRAHNAIFEVKIKYSNQPSDIYPLKGTVKCDFCGKFMTSSNPKGRTKSYTHYECGNKACRRVRIGTTEAHTQFIELLRTIKPTKKTLKLFEYMVFSDWDKQINTAKEEESNINDRISAFEADLISIRKSNDKGIYSDEMAKKEAEKINNEIAVLKVERSDLHFDQYDVEKVRNFTEHFLLNLDRLWDRLTEPAMKQALQSKVFPQGIVCTKDKKIRTVSLSPSFELIMELEASVETSGDAMGIRTPDSLAENQMS